MNRPLGYVRVSQSRCPAGRYVVGVECLTTGRSCRGYSWSSFDLAEMDAIAYLEDPYRA